MKKKANLQDALKKSCKNFKTIDIEQPEYTLVVHVGSSERPATKEDIDAIALQIAQIAKDPALVMVTHHDVRFSYIPRSCLGNSVA